MTGEQRMTAGRWKMRLGLLLAEQRRTVANLIRESSRTVPRAEQLEKLRGELETSRRNVAHVREHVRNATATINAG